MSFLTRQGHHENSGLPNRGRLPQARHIPLPQENQPYMPRQNICPPIVPTNSAHGEAHPTAGMPASLYRCQIVPHGRAASAQPAVCPRDHGPGQGDMTLPCLRQQLSSLLSGTRMCPCPLYRGQSYQLCRLAFCRIRRKQRRQQPKESGILSAE